MKKRMIVIAAVLLAVWLATVPVCGEAESVPGEQDGLLAEQYEASGAGALPEALDDATRELLEQLGIDPEKLCAGTDGISVSGVFDAVVGLFAGFLKVPLTAAALSVLAILLCAVFGSFAGNRLEPMGETAEYAGAMCVCTAALVPFSATMGRVASAVTVCGGFMLAFVPVYCGILVCLGRSAAAAGYRTLIFTLAEVIVRLAKTVLTPLAGCYLALSAAGALSPEMKLRGLSSTVKKTVLWLMGGAMTLFTAVLSVTGAVNAAVDTVTQRTAKFFVGNMLPAVGGAVSEALGSVGGCLSLLRSGVGAYALCAVLFLLLPVLIEILLWKASLSVCAGVAEIFGQSRSAEMLRSVGEGAGMMLSLLVCVMILFIVSLAMMFAGGKSAWT